MNAIVFASTLIKANSDARRPDPREAEQFYSGSPHGLLDLARVAAALGGIAFYAAMLAVVAR
jgi:hypothetical protein